MYSLCVTGSIATGKSTFVRSLAESDIHVELFDADLEVHQLYKSKVFLAELQEHFGSKVLTDGEVDKNYLRNEVFQNEDLKKKLESLIHPRIRNLWLNAKQSALKSQVSLFVSDIPLYFENKNDYIFDGILTVACSYETQLQRLLKRSKLDPSLAKRIISSQLEIDEKMKLSDFVIWNEGDLNSFQLQSETLINHINNV